MNARCLVLVALVGLLFSFVDTAHAAGITILHNFAALDDGRTPQAGLALSGNTLYGNTRAGGQPGATGTVFKLDTDGTDYQVLHSFFGGLDDGDQPFGPVAVTGSQVFGTTLLGGQSQRGTVFAMSDNGSGFQVLHSFSTEAGEGLNPTGATSDGTSIFGTTGAAGSPSSFGALFKLNPDASGFQSMHTFVGPPTDGSGPAAPMILLGSTLYGTTGGGGAMGRGTVYKINTDGTGYQLIHEFAGGPNDGAQPSYANLIASGNTLYGVTVLGGDFNAGCVFRMNIDGTGFQLLHEFSGQLQAAPNDGFWPDRGLALIGSTLYGVTIFGGISDQGTLFSLNSDGTGFQVLHKFLGGTDGLHPSGALLAHESILYGVTEGGGTIGFGTVFAFAVAEPSTLALAGGGLALIGMAMLRRRLPLRLMPRIFGNELRNRASNGWLN